MKDYRRLIENVQNRTNPENISISKSFSDELSSISYSDVLRYVRYAMKAVEPEYTQKSRLAGENVQTHLKRNLQSVIYRYQGSVMTNTHIRGNSDIDLLVISDLFYSFDRETICRTVSTDSLQTNLNYNQIQKLQNELQGGGYANTFFDLRKNRIDSENTLIPVYDICDITHPKAIKIKNKNLNREVDIVIANWYDNVNSVLNNKDSDYRGIQVYNKDSNSKGNPDYPFLSIKRINDRSSATNGRLKRMIRFLKNIKVDSKVDIKLSSFDINAICYDIDTAKYWNKNFYELVPVVYLQLKSLVEDSYHSNRLKSVDGNEYIFLGNPGKLENLRQMMNEIDSVLLDLKRSVVI